MAIKDNPFDRIKDTVGHLPNKEDVRVVNEIIQRIEGRVIIFSTLLKDLSEHDLNLITTYLKELTDKNRKTVAKKIIMILQKNGVEPADRIAWSLINQASGIKEFVADALLCFTLEQKPKKLRKIPQKSR